jgi:signal transduction histidine kinase
VTRGRGWLRQVAVVRTDLYLPAALAVITQIDVWLPPPFNLGHVVGPPAVVSLLYLVTSALLVWRRQAPLAVLAAIVTVDALEYLAFGAPEGLGSLLPTTIAFYAVGRHARAGALMVAVPLVVLGTAVHELRDPLFVFDGGEAVFYLVLGAAWPLGRAFQRNATQRAAIEHRSQALALERDRSARQAAAEERARISRELHDVVGHGLTVVVLQLLAAEGLFDAGDVELGRTKLVSAEESARAALEEMRRLLVLLGEDGAGSPGPQPGLGDLDRLLDQARAAGGQISLTVEGETQQIPAGVDLAAYRIVQEGLTNVLKHARPPRATVRICYEADAVAVEILDEGAPASAPGDGAGRGLTSLRERVLLYGGVIRTGPRPGTGFAVSARLPVPCR